MRLAVVFGALRVSTDFVDYPYFADLGAAQGAALLAAAGHEVILADAFAQPGAGVQPDADPGYLRLGAAGAAVAATVPPVDLVVVAYTPFHRPPARDPPLAELLTALRSRHVGPILLADLYQSGQHYVDSPPTTVTDAYPEVSAYLKYEAEAALVAWVEALVAGRPPPSLVREPPPLDELPLPAWELLDLDARFAFAARLEAGLGRRGWAFPVAGPSLPVVTSRGCPYRCLHCSSNPGLGPGRPKVQRRYSLAYLERAFARLAALGAKRLHLLDELLNVDEAHFDGVLALLDRLDLRYEIPNGLRADYLEERHLRRLRRRVTTVSVSAESGVQRVVDEVVGKRLDLGTIERVAATAKQVGVPLLVHFIVGLPGESRREVNQTLDYAARLSEVHGAMPAVQFATPLPGTRLHAQAAAVGQATAADDYGPRFQRLPLLDSPSLRAEELAAMRDSFHRRLRAGTTPEKLIVNVTYRCNNKCSFCAVGTREQLDGDLQKQKEHLGRWLRRGVRQVDFDGGEPTLHDGLLGLVAYARAIGYRRINVTTNGRRLAYDDYAKALVGSGLTTLLISIHGPDRATHAREVMVYEAFDQTVAGLRQACAARDQLGAAVEIGVNITLTVGNYRRLGEVAELALAAGAPWLNVQFLTPFGRATRRSAPDTADAARVTREVIDRYRDRMRLQVINLPLCFLPGYEAFVVGDVGKLDRRMVFVNNDDVNLAEYLAERRVRRPVCDECVHGVACGGFYELDEVPEPPWLIAPAALVRPLSLPALRPR